MHLQNKHTKSLFEVHAQSLSGISMTRAIVFWIAFPRILFVSDNITEDVNMENDITQFNALICPGSLKASFFQIAISINNFVELQFSNSNAFLDTKKIMQDHWENSLACLTKIQSEVNELIKVLTDHLRKHQQNKDTILLVSQLKKLDQCDIEIENQQKEYKVVKTAKELSTIDHPKIFGDEKNLKIDLQELVEQRDILDNILRYVDEIVNDDKFDIPKSLNILKFLKELVCTEIIHFTNADAIHKCEDPDDDLDHFQSQYEGLYEIWRIIGATYSLVINFREECHDWHLMKERILMVQHMVETGFHEVMNSCKNNYAVQNDSKAHS